MRPKSDEARSVQIRSEHLLALGKQAPAVTGWLIVPQGFEQRVCCMGYWASYDDAAEHARSHGWELVR